MTDERFSIDGRELTVTSRREEDRVIVEFQLSHGPVCILHWGVRGLGRVWKRPPDSAWPSGTSSTDLSSADTPFMDHGSGGGRIRIELTMPISAQGLTYVLHVPEKKCWLKNGNDDFFIPFEPDTSAGAAAQRLAGVADAIIDAEVNKGSWTLMHRFNLCHDLLGEASSDQDVMALLYAWMRYSAIRQLDWQRSFNTKPKELSHSQERLTLRIAGLYRQRPEIRSWLRLILGTLGRGGEGQQIRDEILHIMHRHHIKETHGHFMEEWHQKLHNNTTPDDVVICEAYIAFLESNGDKGTYFHVLGRGGITRERLASFERPIKTDPHMGGGDIGWLIRDFKNYLRILKSVHSGTDLETAFAAARGQLSQELAAKVSDVMGMRGGNTPIQHLTGAITHAREMLAGVCASKSDDRSLRELLYLDLGLEELFRLSVEKQNLGQFHLNDLAELMRLTLRNAILAAPTREWNLCSTHWEALSRMSRDGAEWALHAKSVTDRVSRVVQEFSNVFHGTLQPKAELLGHAFKAKDWVIPIFSEEVVRGGIVFVLSLLLRRLDPVLRSAAGLGGWQVVSSSQTAGKVRTVESLMAVQGERYAEPTVLVTDQVSGNEDIPEGVTAVITTATLDLVSHVAVRARNGHILFATCFDTEPYSRLKQLAGKTLAFEVSAGGDVQFSEASAATNAASAKSAVKPNGQAVRRRLFSTWAASAREFTREIAGGKSNNLNSLRGRLPDWIGFPKSIVLPFGVFEKLLGAPANRELCAKFEAALSTIESANAESLSRTRALLLDLKPVPELESALRETWQRAALPEMQWDESWTAIKRVWASKWNERAYLSRRALGIGHGELTMAVLIQEVVSADYAFVIHTANPITGNRAEIFGEVVLGLGETLVGNDPGRALGFVYRKSDGAVTLISYPGKSSGLYGSGMIFRSDSNGEDLEGFAGAGLYDSLLAKEPERRLLDYSNEPLVWDGKFRAELIGKIARIGLEAEKVFDAPQDIEGAVSRGTYFVVQTRPQVGLD